MAIQSLLSKLKKKKSDFHDEYFLPLDICDNAATYWKSKNLGSWHEGTQGEYNTNVFLLYFYYDPKLHSSIIGISFFKEIINTVIHHAA